MAQDEALLLTVSADVRRLVKAMDEARGTTNRQLTAIEKRFDRMNAHVKRSGDDMARDLRTSIAAIGISAAISQVTNYGDVWTTASNKLAAAGVEQGKLAATMQQIVALSKETGSSFEATADLYSKIQRNAAQLGLTQTEILKITEQVNKAFVAGGAAAGEQASGILQLGQALGSGVLQGDELKALRENAPVLAQAIANEFKTTIAGLKELGAQGELTSARVAKAILEADGIQAQFARTTRTVAQAMENLRTEFTRYIAESRVAQGVVQALSGFIKFATDNMDALADAAIVAAAVIGGALAAGAIVRFVAALSTMIRTAQAAATAMQALRIATTFFTGPIGAVILGIGAALGTMALSADDAGDATDRATKSLDAIDKLQQSLRSNTDALTAARERLNEAVRNGGIAAQNASVLEIDAIEKRIKGEQRLLEIEKAKANLALNDKAAEFRTKRVPVPGLLPGLNETLGGGLPLAAQEELFVKGLRRRGLTRDQFQEQVVERSRFGELDEETRTLFEISEAVRAYDAELEGLIQRQKDLADLTDASKNKWVLDMPGGDGDAPASAKATRNVAGYQTALEKLTATITGLRAASAADEDLRGRTTMAVDSFEETGDAEDEEAYLAELEKRRASLTDLIQKQGAAERERSREAVQALLDYASATNSAGDALRRLPNLGDVLVGADAGLAKTELSKMAQAAADAVAVGVDKIGAEFVSTVTAIEKARSDAIAAGIADLAQFDRALQAAFDDLDTQLEEPIAAPFPYDMDALTSEMLSFDLPDFVDELADLREGMRDAVKQCLQEGIRTDNWGEALRGVLASAITGALDDSLNTLADTITDIISGKSGGTDWLAAAASFVGFGRATGGSVYGGQTVMVGENGPELLRMGRGQEGQVLNAAMTNRALGGRSGVNVVTNVTLNGSDDKLRHEFAQILDVRDRRLMSAVPATVNATLSDNRMQKRRL